MSVNELIKRAYEAVDREQDVARLKLTMLELCNELSNQQVVNLKLEATVHRFVKECE